MNVTVWFRWNPIDREWKLNHIEDGHSAIETPVDPFNRNWKSARWYKRHGTLGAPGRFGGPVLSIDPMTESS